MVESSKQAGKAINVSTQEEYKEIIEGKTCIVYFWQSKKKQSDFIDNDLLKQMCKIITIARIDIDTIGGPFKDFIVDCISDL